MSQSASHAAAADFLKRGGETGALIAAYDWAATALGPIHDWPQSLRSAVGIVVHSPVPIVMLWGSDGFMIYNDAYSRFAGGRHPRLLGSKVREGWPEVADFNDHVMRVGLAGGTLAYKDQELTLNRHGRAEQVWMDLDYSPVPDESGEPAGVIAIVVETTQRVLADRRLAADRDRLARMFEQAPTFMALLRGPEHRFELANPGYMRLIGGREVIGHTLADVLPDAVSQGYLDLLDEVFRSGRAFAANGARFLAQASAGAPVQERFLDFVYQPITDDDGRVSGIFVEGVDVTDRTLAEAARRDSEERLRHLNADLERQVIERSHERGRTWQISPYLLSVLDADGCFESSNPAWQQVLGWSAEELAGLHYSALLHPDDLLHSRAAFAQVARGEPVLRLENRLRGKHDEYRWLAWVLVPEAGKYYGMARDITAEKEQAAELELAQSALRQAQKMEAVGQLTGGLAHDFNNLLTGITGSLELLQARVAQGRAHEVERYVSAAQGAARRAAALTHRLLAFARRQTLDPKPTDINRLVAGMEDLIQRTVGPQIAVERVGAAGLWTTQVDPNQLENALLNLCINARDAMPEGGTLTIETGNRWLDQRAARERSLAPGQYVSLCVSDTGSGMSPEVIARAFDPFFTTKPIGMGTGLGLSMIYGFAQQSGGQVRIYSEPGAGSMVCIYLPRYHGEVTVEGETDAAEPGRVGQGETVLVIDDEATVRMLVVEVLNDLGYHALEAADGAAGLRILQSGVHVDLLISDVGLPGGMNGRQVADAARQLRPDLEVLFITGYAENAVVSHGHLDHGMHVLTKPFAMSVLAERIQRLVARR